MCHVFTTNIGVPRGDCLSPILFVIYLADALKESEQTNVHKHLIDHNYSKHVISEFTLEQQYADDIGYATTSEERKRKIKEEIPPKLRERNLNVNNSKTEEYEIYREGNTDWHKCKYLGSHFNTETDINRRKILAQNSYNQLRDIFDSKRATLKTKLKILNSHVQSIFLYNSELWTVTQKLESTIDVFQRNLLRQILKIRWPDKISNEQLYKMTNQKPWSQEVKKRRISWYGHLMRLPEETPAKRALREYQRYVRKPRGKAKTTWLDVIDKDFRKIKVVVIGGDGKQKSIGLEEAAKNKVMWQNLTRRAMSQ